MAKKGGIQHEKTLQSYFQELESNGYKTLNLEGKCPDGIAIKDGKIYAVEILRKIRYERKNPESIKRHGRFTWKFQSGNTLTSKLKAYHMFEKVLIKIYKAE